MKESRAESMQSQHPHPSHSLSSPLVLVRILSTSKGHHSSSNHTPFPDIPTLYPCLFDHMIISCSHLQTLPHGCPIHPPHILTSDFSTHASCVKTRHPIILLPSLFLPNIASQADHHPFGPNPFFKTPAHLAISPSTAN